jgi:electron transfer flavoprotein alpha subunit
VLRSGPGELNPHCRRAVAKAVELARAHGGDATVLTLGPPSAEGALLECLAWGADEALHLTDPLFAGSDTLATARTLAAAIRREGPFDLILAGRNSVDGDTGQLAPELAELLDLPFVPTARSLVLDGDLLEAVCELEDGSQTIRTRLPALVSCAERLCSPAKVPAEEWQAMPRQHLRRITAADLGEGPWGEAASPTRVGPIRSMASARARLRFDVEDESGIREVAAAIAVRTPRAVTTTADAVHPPAAAPHSVIAVVHETGNHGMTRELLGGAARLAHEVKAKVVLISADRHDPAEVGSWGADSIAVARQDHAEEFAGLLATWTVEHRPWAIVVPSSTWGREAAGRTAAALGAGLIGDAIDLECAAGRLVAWKPAFGGSLVAAISSTSQTQLVTVRPGVLPLLTPRPDCTARVESASLSTVRLARVEILDRYRDDVPGTLQAARAVIGVGNGVDPEDLRLLEPLRGVMNAEFAASRRVTDQGWLPHARQVGITGQSIAPDVYVAVGISGKFNHTVGVRSAGLVVAINADPDAPIFEASDLGVVGDWRQVVSLLTDALMSRSGRLTAADHPS